MQTRQTWTCVFQLLLLVSGFAVSGCGTAAVVASSEPIHVNLFCLAARAEGQSVTCDPQKRLSSLNSWFMEAMYRPNSTFSIWAVGPDRLGSKRFFIACIPDHWRAPVSKEKGAFIAKARAGAGGGKAGMSEPAGCRAPGQTTPGRAFRYHRRNFIR
jgi:hypothetical protein